MLKSIKHTHTHTHTYTHTQGSIKMPCPIKSPFLTSCVFLILYCYKPLSSCQQVVGLKLVKERRRNNSLQVESALSKLFRSTHFKMQQIQIMKLKLKEKQRKVMLPTTITTTKNQSSCFLNIIPIPKP